MADGKACARFLRMVQLTVRRPNALPKLQALADVGPLLGTVIGNERDLLRGFGRRFLQNLVRTIMVVVVDEGKKRRKLLVTVLKPRRRRSAALQLMNGRRAAGIVFARRGKARYFSVVGHLANGLFPKTIKLFIGLLKGIALLYCENDNGIAPVLAIQLVYARRLKQAIGFPEIKPHGKRQLQNLVA